MRSTILHHMHSFGGKSKCFYKSNFSQIALLIMIAILSRCTCMCSSQVLKRSCWNPSVCRSICVYSDTHEAWFDGAWRAIGDSPLASECYHQGFIDQTQITIKKIRHTPDLPHLSYQNKIHSYGSTLEVWKNGRLVVIQQKHLLMSS